ncbi:hypothetical protein PGTUg99_006332 [Puccinia graminis f. sp. tritici]|uniref:Uncharacterized protein n=1 Tax=Puccinia graminis f. sp. tritici TaxID=56615 RepID=A0A5B0S2K8_PUCGR|nr:hypothetical protein PGTUg99_006332 [Puccinia graminis f. sp. tritici]
MALHEICTLDEPLSTINAASAICRLPDLRHSARSAGSRGVTEHFDCQRLLGPVMGSWAQPTRGLRYDLPISEPGLFDSAAG